MNPKTHDFEAVIQKVPDIDGAYIAVPFDIKAEFGKRRVKVRATFDGEPFPVAGRKAYCSEKCREIGQKAADADRAKKYRKNKGSTVTD